jgi:MerR family transcriptional regulator, copper efflux regulator
MLSLQIPGLNMSLDLSPRGRVYRMVVSRNSFLIGEIAKRSGASRKALRLYEAAGILPAPRRTAAGYRIYGEADLHRLEFIREAKTLGLTLKAIRELIVAVRASGNGSTRARVLNMLDSRISQTTIQIAALTRLRKELERRRAALARRPPRRGVHGYCTCLHKSE